MWARACRGACVCVCMESASEAPGAMAADEAPCDPSLSSAAPPPAPPPSSSAASTKRRWSPCTWRYAIEDAQAELPSRPRATVPLNSTFAPPPSRTPHSSPSLQQPIKAKPPCHNPLYGKAAEEPQRINALPFRAHTVLDPRAPSSPSQPQAVLTSSSREVYRKSQRHLYSSKSRACKEDANEEDGDVEDDDSNDDDGCAVYDEQYFKMRRREMSPSELYFCAICSTEAAETKGRMRHSSYDNC